MSSDSLSRRSFMLGLGAMVATIPLASCTSAPTQSDPPVATGDAAPTSSGPAPTGRWLSGASDESAADGSFGEWRGRPVEVVGTWIDTTVESQINGIGRAIGPASKWSNWTGPLDIAVGAIFAGETWADAATGSYDDRWAAALQTLKDQWGERDPANLYIRFAHEFNGNWYPWSVRPDEIEDFKRSWNRFTERTRKLLPTAKMVWSGNSGTRWDYDVRTAFPGVDTVDVVSVDWYNSYPFVESADGFAEKIDLVEANGGPIGVEQWRRFAESVGLPLAISEWSSAAADSGGGGGDSPVFFELFHAWLAEHSGPAAGQVLYEVLFNVPGYESKFELYPETSQPTAAEKYRELW